MHEQHAAHVWKRAHEHQSLRLPLRRIREPYLENHPESVIAEVRRLEPLLLGSDPLQREALWQAMYSGGNGYKGGPLTMSAISGIDIALWDIAGKWAGVPIY